MSGCIPCSGLKPGYERVYRYVRTGHKVVESTSQAEVEQLQREAGGAGRIERRVRRTDTRANR